MSDRETLSRSFSENRMFLICASAGFLVPLLVAFSYGAKISELSYVLSVFGMAFDFVLVMFALTVVFLYPYIFLKEKQGWSWTKSHVNRMMRSYTEGERLIEAIPVSLALLMMFNMIAIIKSLIVQINPYHLDPLFAELDFKLHMGHYPQYLLAPLIERLSLVPLVNYAYNFWFGVMMCSYWYAAFMDTDKRRRNVFLWTSLSAWIFVGWFMATSLSSVGPLYFSSFYSGVPDPYADYLRHLNDIDENVSMITSLWVGNYLLQISRDPAVIDINGISAMPSMHVMIAAISALYMWSLNKWLGLATAGFTVLVMIGSVYLAWHYAIDGYVAVVLAGLLWLVFRRIFQRTA